MQCVSQYSYSIISVPCSRWSWHRAPLQHPQRANRCLRACPLLHPSCQPSAQQHTYTLLLLHTFFSPASLCCSSVSLFSLPSSFPLFHCWFPSLHFEALLRFVCRSWNTQRWKWFDILWRGNCWNNYNKLVTKNCLCKDMLILGEGICLFVSNMQIKDVLKWFFLFPPQNIGIIYIISRNTDQISPN